MTDFLKYKQNRKIWKVLSLGKVNWHNLLEQFPHISTTNFATLFSSENLKEKTTIFRNCNFFGQSYFLHSGNQVFAYISCLQDLSLYKESIFAWFVHESCIIELCILNKHNPPRTSILAYFFSTYNPKEVEQTYLF